MSTLIDGDVFPIGDGPSLNELQGMEPEYAFRCVDCGDIFETVVDWVRHALENHSDGLPGIDPIRKQ